MASDTEICRMPTTFRPYSPDQDLLLQPSLRDWLPARHLVGKDIGTGQIACSVEAFLDALLFQAAEE